MNKKTGYILPVLITVIAVAVLVSAVTSEDNSSEIIAVNKDITRTIGFSINSGSAGLNTSAEGTVFIEGDGNIPEYVRIVSWVNIDPNDWGGVTFDVPAGWKISGITSSYPENDSPAAPSDYLSTWTTADKESKWSARVEVGRDRGYVPATGGTGTVIVDLVPDKDATSAPGTSNIMISVGSDKKDGIMICGTDFVEIPLSLTDDGI